MDGDVVIAGRQQRRCRRLRQQHRRRRDDRGFTLVEVAVAMTIMTIFLGIFGGAMISMFNSVTKTQQTGYAAGQANSVFARLDTQIRYSSGISAPATNVFATGDAVVEFVSNAFSGTPTCTQLRLSPTGVLQERTWGQNDSPIVISAPRTLATDILAGTPTAVAGPTTTVAGPFAVLAPSGTTSTQRLEIAVTAQYLRNSAAVASRTRSIDVTFAAINTGTDLGTSPQSFCSQGRPPSTTSWPSA